MATNVEVYFASLPGYAPATSASFGCRTCAYPTMVDGESCVVCATEWISVDPYLRCRMADDTGVEYTAPYTLNHCMSSGGVGRVIQSSSEAYSIGDIVTSHEWPWQQYVKLPVTTGDDPATLGSGVRPIGYDSIALGSSLALGVLGIPGLTAWFGIVKEAHIAAGDTVVVSGAAGATGSIAVQLIRAKFPTVKRIVGICGGPMKCDYLRSLGCDTIDYKAVGSGVDAMRSALLAVTEGAGVDVYFDNVGGSISEAVIACCNPKARVVICGQIANYENEKAATYPDDLPAALQKEVESKGIQRSRYLVLRYADEFRDAVVDLATLVSKGDVVLKETIVKGIEHTGEAFVTMMGGGNLGKQLVDCRTTP